MELSDLNGKYVGARIGILGSGPTLSDYKDNINELCDIIIACNGSVMALNPKDHSIDYFLYGDKEAYKRMWFNKSIFFKNQSKGDVVRILPYFMLPFDNNVLTSKNERRQIQEELDAHIHSNQSLNPNCYRSFIPSNQIILNTGINFSYSGELPEDLSEFICGSGTITGVGAQLAYNFGASVINLFGCGFNNPVGGNYAYDNKGEPGGTLDRHSINMDHILSLIKKQGVEVISFGETSLKSPKVIL